MTNAAYSRRGLHHRYELDGSNIRNTLYMILVFHPFILGFHLKLDLGCLEADSDLVCCGTLDRYQWCATKKRFVYFSHIFMGFDHSDIGIKLFFSVYIMPPSLSSIVSNPLTSEPNSPPSPLSPPSPILLIPLVISSYKYQNWTPDSHISLPYPSSTNLMIIITQCYKRVEVSTDYFPSA